jgi:anti-anti-sigma factor
MELTVTVEGDIPVLDIAGEIDHFVAPKLQRQIDELIESGNVKLVFDFSNVNYLDSGGIGVLFNAMQQLAPRQGRIAIVCADPNVIRILELVGMFDKRTHVFLFDRRRRALKGLGGTIKVG